jgi:LysM repeat protein
VKAGDTLSGIAKTYQTSVADLQRWNSLGKDAKLRPGQRLLVSNPSQPAPAAPSSPAQKAKAPAGPKRPAVSKTQ